ncbi:uncharacterized protein BDV17DRAFT_291893 [Aspergillus undulatus]|uniref:uncharacterized protein n=1 Tax=Aspergillus undulatus TaxID=1810928 RepID=UPI003CCCCA64
MSITSWLLSAYINEVQDSEWFMTAKHSIKAGLTASAVVSSWTIATTLLTSMAFGYRYGVSGPFWYAAAAVELKRKAPNAQTYLQVVKVRYGSAVHLLFTTYSGVYQIITTMNLLVGGSTFVASMTGVDVPAQTQETSLNDASAPLTSLETHPGDEPHYPVLNAPVADLNLDWEMLNTSFSLPDMGYLFSWMPQDDQYTASHRHLEITAPEPFAPAVPDSSPPHTAQSACANPHLPGQRPFPLFPFLQPSDYDVLNAENYAHVSPISSKVYGELLSFHGAQHPAGSRHYVFPGKIVLDTFIQLYFEYFDPLMPFLHNSLFERNDVHWVLVLAVATMGSQFASIKGRERYTVVLLELLRRALPHDAMSILQYDRTTVAQSALLYNPIIDFPCDNYTSTRTPSQVPRREPDDWQNWIRIEGQRRLVYSAWFFECMAVALMDVEPKLQGEDIDQGLPCDDAMWGARTAREWEECCLMGAAGDGSSTGLRTLFTHFCTSEIDLSQLPEFTNLLLLVTFYVEERKALKGSRALELMHGDKNKNKKTPNVSAPSDRRLDLKWQSLRPVKPPNATWRSSLSASDELVFQTRTIFYHVLFILRHISLSSLHRTSGWRATPSETDRSRRSLTTWIRENPRTARECLFHAAVAFSQFGNANAFNCPHPLALLVAVQYLRLYQRERIYNHSITGQETTTSASEYPAHMNSQHPSQIQTRQSTVIFRINPRQTEQDAAITRWISGDINLSLHLPGVGLLLEPRSAVCLLREFQRLLGSSERPGWSILRGRLGENVEEILNEIKPLSQPPYSLDFEA